MSGDIGDGTTLATVKLSQKVLAAGLPGYVQLAGGTNSYTVPKLQAAGLLKRRQEARGTRHEQETNSPLAGIAYGSYARVLLSPILDQLETIEMNKSSVMPIVRLEENPELLWQAVKLADSLVSQLKSVQKC
jgi:hypothetical protein